MASKIARGKKANLHAAKDILRKLEFGERQSNQMAALVLLALVDLRPNQTWSHAAAPLCGITPIIAFIGKNYGVQYAPNTRETIRDEAVKFFADAGLLVRNPDQPSRPTTSANTVYQIETVALELLRCYGQTTWPRKLTEYLARRSSILAEIERQRTLARIPVTLPDGRQVSLSGGGQNPLIKAVVKSSALDSPLTDSCSILGIPNRNSGTLKRNILPRLKLYSMPPPRCPMSWYMIGGATG